MGSRGLAKTLAHDHFDRDFAGAQSRIREPCFFMAASSRLELPVDIISKIASRTSNASLSTSPPGEQLLQVSQFFMTRILWAQLVVWSKLTNRQFDFTYILNSHLDTT